MGLIFRNMKVMELNTYSDEYVEGPIVITPGKIKINDGYSYVGIQSVYYENDSMYETETDLITGFKSKYNKLPILRFWLLDHIEDGYVSSPSEIKYDDYPTIVKLGERVATTIVASLYHGIFDRKRYDKKIHADKEFSKEVGIYYNPQEYVDSFRHEICYCCSNTINNQYIESLLDKYSEEDLNNIYTILGRV